MDRTVTTEKEDYSQIEKRRWKIHLLLTLLSFFLAFALLIMVYSFDVFSGLRLGTFWDVYKVLFAVFTVGFLSYLTYLAQTEQSKIQKLMEKVTDNTDLLKRNTEAISLLNENIMKLFQLRQVCGLPEFLKVLLRLLGADGGVIFFTEGKAQTLVETLDGKISSQQEAVISKVRKIFEEGKTNYFGPVNPGKKGSDPSDSEFSLIVAPLNFEGRLGGLVAFWREGNFFEESDYNLLLNLSKGIEIAMANAYLLEEKEDMLKGLAEELVNWIEMEAPTRKGHAREVAYLAGRIAEEMGLSEFEVREIQLAALVHDVGLGGVDRLVLEKPGKLSPEERREVERHVELGKAILEKARFPQRIVSVVYHHHEKCDGTGYPLGLKRDQIPLGSRIIAVADAFDALTHRRAHRGAEDKSEAIKLLQKGIPQRFDPQVVQAFFRVWQEEEATFESSEKLPLNYH